MPLWVSLYYMTEYWTLTLILGKPERQTQEAHLISQVSQLAPFQGEIPCRKHMTTELFKQMAEERKRTEMYWVPALYKALGLPYLTFSHEARLLKESTQYTVCGASLLAQWLRSRLPMQGTQVQALVQEDPTCHGATKPMRHNYWACALEPTSHNYWARVPQLLKPMRLGPVLCNKEKPPQWEARAPQQGVAPAHRN